MRFLIYILLLSVGQSISQSKITSASELDKITKVNGIVVVEFWAKWNDKNSCSFLKDLENCNKARADIGVSTTLQTKYNIEVLPTIILFNNSEEICRFKGNLLFQLNVEKKEIQAKIDSIIISKFE